jgi:hypothetical protein
MQVAADRAGVAGRADAADALAGADAVTRPQPRRVLEVRVPVVAVRVLAADDDDVAVEDRVVGRARDPPAAGG